MDSARNQPLINNNYPSKILLIKDLENNQPGWTPPPPPPQNQGYSNNPNPGYNPNFQPQPNYPPQQNTFPMNNQGTTPSYKLRLQQQRPTPKLQYWSTTNDARPTTNAKPQSRYLFNLIIQRK